VAKTVPTVWWRRTAGLVQGKALLGRMEVPPSPGARKIPRGRLQETVGSPRMS
jgi:hypothetical protein